MSTGKQLRIFCAIVACGFTLTQSAVAADASPDDAVLEDKIHWSFQPIRRPGVPDVNDADWVRDPLDRFVLAELESNGFTPNLPADKRILLRRATYDLIGLPPTPAEIEAFVKDTSDNAFERVVERLLGSPHYGERQARHWLDLVRFAETTGHEYDFDIPYAWRYRDFVIRAFNDDVPFDQFVTEHVAGDLMEQPRRNSSTGGNESVLGTTFLWLGSEKSAPVDLRAAECDRIDDQIDVLSRAFLGLSVSCARCHDHKFDPVTIDDYYALAGYLKSSRRQITRVDSAVPTQGIIASLVQNHATLDAMLKAKLTDNDMHAPKAQRVALSHRRPISSAIDVTLRYVSGVAGTLLVMGVLWFRTNHTARTNALVGAGILVVVASVIGFALSLRSNSIIPFLAAEKDNFLSQSASEFARGFRTLAGARSPTEFSRSRDAVVDQLEAISENAASRTDDVVFEDFSDDSYRRWSVTGEAFGVGPVRPGEFVIGSSADRPVQRFLEPNMAHSGRQSGKLRGAMRSEDFRVETAFIHYRIARNLPPSKHDDEDRATEELDTGAKPGQVHLIINGLSKNLIFSDEASVDADEGEQLVWYQQEIEDAWIGQRAYIEIEDSDNGFVAVDQIVFSDNPLPPPNVPGRFLIELLDDPAIDRLSRLSEAVELLFHEAIEVWASGRLKESEAASDYVMILNWLLENGLCENLSANRTTPNLRQAIESLLLETQAIQKKIEAPQLALVAVDGDPHNEFLLSRGDHLAPEQEVTRRWPKFLTGESQVAPAKGSGRLELARWLTDGDNPLFGRVFVNRIWQQHFGEGLVRTPDDFGTMGDRPSHPKLLDYLADEFRRSGNSVKSIKRRILLSSTYRMSSDLSDAKVEKADPDNRSLHRMPFRRLEAEAIRDAMVAVSGRLDRRMYGPGIAPHLTPFMDGRGKPDHSGPLDGHGRRSIYLTVRRNFLPPLLTVFGLPTPDSPRGKRVVTNVPAQALTMMNSDFVRDQAGDWAELILSGDSLSSNESRIRHMYEAAYGRRPSVEETKAALDFLDDKQAPPNALQNTQRWSSLCHVLFNGTEFIYVR